MKIALLLLFALTCFCLLYWGVCRIGRIYQFPFLAGGVFAGFVLPQLIGLINDNSLPEGGLEKTIVVCVLCASMCYYGYVWDTRPLTRFDWSFSCKRLLFVSVLLSAVGGTFFLFIERLPKEMTAEVAQWTGLPVAFLFFANLLSYGFVIAVLLCLITKSKVALFVALVGALSYLHRIVFLGRRAALLDLLFSVLIVLWFSRRYALPRWAMALLLLSGVFLLYSTGEYRYAMLMSEENGWEVLWAITPVENVKKILLYGGEEIRNAVFLIQSVDITKDFDLGVFHWNKFIFNYIPAQLFGNDFKNSLMISVNDDSQQIFGYIPWIGSTNTGMADSFKSFWYFGCANFFLIAYIMRKFYESAMMGNKVAVILYPILVVFALHSITHHTFSFFSPWLHMAIFLFPAFVFSAIEKQFNDLGSTEGKV